MLGPMYEGIKDRNRKSVVDQAEYDNVGIAGRRDFGIKDAISQASNWNLDTVMAVYKKSPYINGFVNYISSQAIHAPLNVYRTAKDGRKTLLTSGQPYTLLHEWINPNTTYIELMTATINWISLVNNAFWILEENNDPATNRISPVSIYLANPRFLKVLIDRDNKIVGYNYQVKDEKIFIPANRVIPFPGWSPDDYWFGNLNIETLDTDIQVERFGKKQAKTYFANKAIISGVLTIEEDVDDEEVKRLEKQFYEQHKGANNAYRIMVLTKGMAYEPFDPNAVDDATVSQIDNSLATYEAVMGVPIMLIQSTYVNTRPQPLIEYEALFWRRTMIPLLERMGATLTKYLAKPISGTLCICPDYRSVRALQLQDLDATRVDIARANAGLNTPNEIRANRNEPPYESDLQEFGNMPTPVWESKYGVQAQKIDSTNLAGTEGGRDQSANSDPGLIDQTGQR